MRELFAGRRGRVAAGLLMGEFTTASQALVIATIMPQIARDLHGLAIYGFAFSALLFAQFVVTAFAGPWGDRYGPRRLLAIGFGLMLVGLALAAYATTMHMFILARVVEGVAGGIDYVTSFALIAKVFPEPMRPKMFALSSAMWVVPALVGPSFGAFIATAFGWRYAFFAFIPLIAIAAALVLPSLGELKPSEETVDAYAGLRMLFSRATLTCATPRNTAFVAFAILQAAFFGADAYVALMLTQVRGLSLNWAGICITLGALGWSGAAALQPMLLTRLGSRHVILVGTLGGALAAVGMIAVDVGAPIALAFVAWLFGGAGIGLGYPTLSLVALSGANEGNEGTISSATLLAGMLGMSIGVAICGLPITIAEQMHTPLSRAVVWTFLIALSGIFVLAPLVRKLPSAHG